MRQNTVMLWLMRDWQPISTPPLPLAKLQHCPQPAFNGLERCLRSSHGTILDSGLEGSMKILYTNFHDGDGGGHTTYVIALARALSRQHSIFIAAPASSRLLRSATSESIATPIPIGFGSGLQSLGQQLVELHTLRRLIKDQKIDLIHVNGARDHRFVMQALTGMRRPPIVFTKHNSKPTRSIGNAIRARWATDRVIAVSTHTAQQLQQGPYRNCPTDVIRNGVDINHFIPAQNDAALSLRQQWTKDTQALVLVSNAGTDEHKGWIDLARAIARLPENIRPHVHMAVAGRDSKPRQYEQVVALGLVGQVHFTGLLDDTRQFIAAGDAGFVLSFDIETISFACREMMASGKPVLVSNYAGLPENIVPDVDGWIVPTRNVDAIAKQVEILYLQRSNLHLAGAAARRHAEADFGLQTFVESTEASYQAALASN